MDKTCYYRGQFFMYGPPPRAGMGDTGRVIHWATITAEHEGLALAGLFVPANADGRPLAIVGRVKRWAWQLGEWLQDWAVK